MPAAEHNQPPDKPQGARLRAYGYTTTCRPGETHIVITQGFDLARARKWAENIVGERLIEIFPLEDS